MMFFDRQNKQSKRLDLGPGARKKQNFWLSIRTLFVYVLTSFPGQEKKTSYLEV